MYWFKSLWFFQESQQKEQMARNNHLTHTFLTKSHCQNLYALMILSNQ